MTSSAGSGIQMNVEELTSVASNVDDLAAALTEMQQYAAGDQISAASFGTAPGAQAAGQAFVAALKAVADSVTKAQTFAEGAHSALQQASKATSTTDEQSAEALFNAGQGAS